MSRQSLKILIPVLVLSIAVSIAKIFVPLNRTHSGLQQKEAFDHVEVHLTSDSAAVERFSQILSIKTVGSKESENHISDPKPFQELHDLLEAQFPLLWKSLKVEKVAEYSLLLEWKGTNSSLKPIVLISHLDVVPADVDGWTHPPFGGTVNDSYIWGRGAMDAKFSVATLLEAASELMKIGHKPTRTVYFVFGHDEEVGGTYGAAATARLLEERGVVAEFIFDEGGTIIEDGLPPFVRSQVALIGTAEKSLGVNVWVQINGTGGHSSLPPIDGSSVASVLSRVLLAVDRNPPPESLVAPVSDFLRGLAPAASWPLSFLLRNCDHWLLKDAWAYALTMNKDTAPMVRTTAAVTRIQAGVADNVLPNAGRALINFRLLPGEDLAFVENYLWKRIGRDAAAVHLRVADVAIGPPVSDPAGLGFQLVKKAIREVLDVSPDKSMIVTPHLLSGGTDSKHYAKLAPGSIYRFVPLVMNRTAHDVARIHGKDERVKVEDFVRGIKFYVHFLRLATS